MSHPPWPWTLMVLAAGMGRRFGGDKQLRPVGPGDATLADYAVADARRSGAAAAIFVVRTELLETFRTHHLRWDGFPVHYAVQQIDQLPEGRSAPGRTRPWGTTHAVLAGATQLTGNCLVTNADDYYGVDAVAAAGRFLAGTDPAVPAAGLVGFRLRDTLSPDGGVSRAIIDHDAGRVTGLREIRDVTQTADGLTGYHHEEAVRLTGNELVSMNCWGFSAALMPLLEQRFAEFLDRHPPENEECALPEVVSSLAREHPVQVIHVGSRWLGMTWPGDIPRVTRALASVPPPFPPAPNVS